MRMRGHAARLSAPGSPEPFRIAAWPGGSRESRRWCSASPTSARSPGRSRSGSRTRARSSRSPSRASASRSRVRELAESVDAKLVTECDVRSDDDVDRVFAETADAFGGGLDLLVHSVAFAAAEDLEGRFIDTPRDRFWMAVDISAYSLVACARARRAADAGARRRLDRDDDLPRRRARRAALQRDGRREGDARRVDAVPRLGSRRRTASASTRSRPGRCARSPPARSPASRRWRRCSSSARPLHRHIDADDCGAAAAYLLSDDAANVTGTTLYVDAGYHAMGHVEGRDFRKGSGRRTATRTPALQPATA